MIAIASAWVLPEGAVYCRQPARPIHRRQPDFAIKFDAYTVFYDCFRMSATQVMLVGPPLVRFGGVLDSLTITALPTGNRCDYAVDHKFATAFANRKTHTLCRLLAHVPQGDTRIQVQSTAGKAVLPIRPSSAELFRGKRVLLTLSKNNELAWICDWMRFYRDLHGADAVLLYDNGSIAYNTQTLLEAMTRVSGFTAICVVEWPYQYGPQGIGRGTWDSAFCQDGALEDARWRFLPEADAVLSCDVDELALVQNGNLFAKAAGSATGYVKFRGRWVTAQAADKIHEKDAIRHRDSTYQLLPEWRWKGFRPKDVNLCPAKWAVVPRRCPPAAQWSVHEIVAMRTEELSLNDACYRHFRQVSTNWKKNRAGLSSDRARNEVDAPLRDAFTRVNWDE